MKYKVVPHRYWLRDDGKTASIHGALPYTSEDEKIRWTQVTKGFTVYNPYTGEYGVGRKPFDTEAEAQEYADKYRPSRVGIGD